MKNPHFYDRDKESAFGTPRRETKAMRLLVDGVETELTLTYKSPWRYDYQPPDHSRSYSFPEPLDVFVRPGAKVTYAGHTFERYA